MQNVSTCLAPTGANVDPDLKEMELIVVPVKVVEILSVTNMLTVS